MKSNPDANQRAVEELLRALPDDVTTFARRSADVGDWNGLVASARDQGVLALLLHYWRDAGVAVPGDALAAARKHCAVEQLWLEQVRTAAAEALAAIRAKGVACIPLKGPVLAKRLYPNVDLRPCVDLDLLVDPRDFESAAAVLAGIGYRSQEGPEADYARRHTHHLHFSRPGAPEIELHFRLYAGFGTVLSADEALSRSRELVTADGAAVRVLSPEDEVMYLALHAAGHSYVRLLWLYDLKLLMRALPGIDWALVESRAREHGVLAVLAFSFRLMASRLGPPPAGALGLGGRPSLRSRVAERLLPVVMKPTVRSARENFESLLFTALLCDRWSAGLGLVAHHVGRATRRRLHRLAPRLLPDSWAG